MRRLDRLEERVRGRRAAAVVADLEDVRAERGGASRAGAPPLRRARRRPRRGTRARRSGCGGRTSCRWRRGRRVRSGHGASTSTTRAADARVLRRPRPGAAPATPRRAQLGEERRVVAARALRPRPGPCPRARRRRRARAPRRKPAEVIGMRMREHDRAERAAPPRARARARRRARRRRPGSRRGRRRRSASRCRRAGRRARRRPGRRRGT